MVACMSRRAGTEVLDLLIDCGADVNAPVKEKRRQGGRERDTQTLPLAVCRKASLEKLKLLFRRGADIQVRSSKGYTLALLAAYEDRPELMDYLIHAGAPLDVVTSYKESALGILSREGRFAEVHKLLAHGADPTPLRWTALMHAVAEGDLNKVKSLVKGGAELEATDGWKRTAFLLALHAGHREIAAYLLAQGASRDASGQSHLPAMAYPAKGNDAGMLQWLLDQGFDLEEADHSGDTPLAIAVLAGATACVRLLLNAGADWQRERSEAGPLMGYASEPEIIRMLVARGADLADLDTVALRSFIGLGNAGTLAVSRQDYFEGRFRRFGSANPERMEIPFWKVMVRCGWCAYWAGEQFQDDPYKRGAPAWCHDRYGMSFTSLPDGRFVQIGGEHEDSYDPDFCIYNEVFIHDGKGGFEILGYPEEVFPPTDFHSATLLGEWIYIIGNLGYHTARGDRTPVYRLHVGTWRIEKVATAGDDPGWISRHKARVEAGRIRISGGERLVAAEDGSQDLAENAAEYWFDPASGVWERISAET